MSSVYVYFRTLSRNHQHPSSPISFNCSIACRTLF